MWLLVLLRLLGCAQSLNTTSFNGTDFFPTNHECARCCFKEFKELNVNQTMNECDILSSTEGTSFLLLHPNGTLQIYKNDILTWSSCDEYNNMNLNCHQTAIGGNKLFLDKNGILTLNNTIQNKTMWQKGYKISNGYSLQMSDHGHLILSIRFKCNMDIR